MPDLKPLYGRVWVANLVIWLFLTTGFPYFISSTVKLLGSFPGLIISILLSKIRSRTGAFLK